MQSGMVCVCVCVHAENATLFEDLIGSQMRYRVGSGIRSKDET